MKGALPTTVAHLRTLVDRYVQPSDEEFAQLLSYLQEHQLAPKTSLCRPGEVCDRLYVVLDGIGRQFATVSGQEHTTGFSGPGDLLTDLTSFLTRQPSQLHLATVTPVYAFSIRYHELQALYAASPLWERCGRLLVERYALELTQRAAALQFRSAAERYAALLQGRPALFNAVPLNQIASFLGVVQETLSRLRRQPPPDRMTLLGKAKDGVESS